MTQQPNPNAQHGTEGPGSVPEQNPLSPRRVLFGAVLALLIFAVIAGVGIFRRTHAGTVLAQHTDQLAPPTVDVAPAASGAPTETLVLPGNVTAYTDSPIYARTDGYLQHWSYDIGAKVKKGALLAVIETPELDNQVAQAQSELATAEANAHIAHIQAERYSNLVKSDAVSQQDTDTFVSQAASTASAVNSAQANLQRLKELQSFEKVYAPFDGVVTARSVDTGQLISSGSGQSAGTQLFHMQAVQTLRVYANVPQMDSQTLKHGMKVDVTFPEYPARTFTGTLVRTADAIDPVSRTLLAEVDVDNRSGQLMPGALAQVHFKTSRVVPTYIVPSTALIFRRQGLQVGTVVHSDIAHLVDVKIGEDDGATVQIVSGLNAGDQIIQDPPDSLIDGEKVTVVKPGDTPSHEGGL
jgi:RND family efflux transporter MFP subunit